MEGHDSTDYSLPYKCVICTGIHSSFSKDCPQWVIEKQLQKLDIINQIAYPEARRIVTVTPTTITGTNLPSFTRVITPTYRSCGQQATLTSDGKLLQPAKNYRSQSTQTTITHAQASTQTIVSPEPHSHSMRENLHSQTSEKHPRLVRWC